MSRGARRGPAPPSAPPERRQGWLPRPLGHLIDEIDERLARIPTRLNEYGYDPFGMDPEYGRRLALVLALAYRYWFRAESEGIENVPEGRVLLIANHAGNNFAWDGARRRADFLVNISNDGWFLHGDELPQHLASCVFRAVENRVGVARAVNTGISGFIDPAGRILASTPLLKDAVITRPLPLLNIKTLYTRFGDVLAWACLAVTLFLILLDFGKYVFRRRIR